MTGYVYRDPRRGRHMPTATEANVARAITTPDSVTGRRMHEARAAWQARAVLDVIVTAIREGREPFAGIWDDAVAAGREDERQRLLARLRASAGQGDDLAAIIADIVREHT